MAHGLNSPPAERARNTYDASRDFSLRAWGSDIAPSEYDAGIDLSQIAHPVPITRFAD